MCASSTDRADGLRRNRRGNAAVEFAITLPFLLGVLVILVEVGRMLMLSQTLEKGVRAGGMYATRAELPLDADSLAKIENLVRYGNLEGTGEPILPGWSPGVGSVTVTTAAASAGGADVAVIVLDAVAPYEPLMPGLLGFLGFDAETLGARQEIVHVGS